MIYAIMALTATLGLLGDYWVRVSTTAPNPIFYQIGAAVAWAIDVPLWCLIYRRFDFVKIATIYSPFCTLAFAAIGILCFGDVLSIRKGVALGFALCAIALSE